MGAPNFARCSLFHAGIQQRSIIDKKITQWYYNSTYKIFIFICWIARLILMNNYLAKLKKTVNFGSLGLLRYTEESFLLLRQGPAVPVTEQQSILANTQVHPLGCMD